MNDYSILVCAHGTCSNCGWEVRYPNERCESCGQSIRWMNSLPENHHAEFERLQARCDFWRHTALFMLPTFSMFMTAVITRIIEEFIK